MIRTAFHRHFLLLAGLLLILSSCSDNGTNSNPIEDIRVSKIEYICDSLIKNIPELSSIIIGVWDEPHNFTYTKAFGISDTRTKTPANVEMISRIGSVTKTFTTTIALMLVDSAKINLKDDITQYLPEYQSLNGITIEMLCNMTSGIPDYAVLPEFRQKLLSELNIYQAPTKLVDLALTIPALSTPGTEFHYSSTNTILLGMIIEKITGKKIEDLINSKIIKQIGLNNTYLPINNLMPNPNYLHGYILGLDFAELAHPSWAWAAGAMISDIYDLKKWAEVLIKGNLLSASLQQSRFNGISVSDSTYGLGITTIGDNLWGHSGTVPGYETALMTDRYQKRTFVVFFNTYTDLTRPEELLRKIVQILN